MNLTEAIADCWHQGMSIQDTIQSILRKTGVGVSFEFVRRKFAEMSQ